MADCCQIGLLHNLILREQPDKLPAHAADFHIFLPTAVASSSKVYVIKGLAANESLCAASLWSVQSNASLLAQKVPSIMCLHMTIYMYT